MAYQSLFSNRNWSQWWYGSWCFIVLDIPYSYKDLCMLIPVNSISCGCNRFPCSIRMAASWDITELTQEDWIWTGRGDKLRLRWSHQYSTHWNCWRGTMMMKTFHWMCSLTSTHIPTAKQAFCTATQSQQCLQILRIWSKLQSSRGRRTAHLHAVWCYIHDHPLSSKPLNHHVDFAVIVLMRTCSTCKSIILWCLDLSRFHLTTILSHWRLVQNQMSNMCFSQPRWDADPGKAGCARRVAGSMFPGTMCYTLEVSFFGRSESCDDTSNKHTEHFSNSIKGYKEMGRRLAMAFLDFYGLRSMKVESAPNSALARKPPRWNCWLDSAVAGDSLAQQEVKNLKRSYRQPIT